MKNIILQIKLPQFAMDQHGERIKPHTVLSGGLELGLHALDYIVLCRYGV